MEDPFEDFIKHIRGKGKSKLEKPQEQSREQLRIIEQRKRECQHKALKIVEFLIEGELRPEVFLRCLKHINQSYYDDVVEERAISKLCGYSLCGKQLPDMPKKQYFINVKNNKLHDITDRKNYCSNFCYKASVYIKQQIDDSPLWLRNPADPPKSFNLLTNGGSPGVEIPQTLTKPIEDPAFTSIGSFTEIALNEMVDDNTNPCSKKPKIEKSINLGVLKEVEEPSESSLEKDVNTTDNLIENKAMQHINKNIELRKVEKRKVTLTKPIKTANGTEVVKTILKYFHEWITFDTYIFLHGEAKVKEALRERNLQEYFENWKQNELTIEQKKEYAETCKKLNLMYVVDHVHDRKLVTCTQTKPVPDFKKLQEDSKAMNLKISAFYDGEVFDVNEKTKSVEKSEKSAMGGDEFVLPDYPLVDQMSPTAMRYKIYLQSIERVIANTIQNLGIQSYITVVTKDVKQLVKTFRLLPHNIIFQPSSSNLIVFILIKILSIRSEEVSKRLEMEQAQRFMKIIWSCFPTAEEQVQELLENIQDINLFVKYYFSNTQK